MILKILSNFSGNKYHFLLFLLQLVFIEPLVYAQKIDSIWVVNNYTKLERMIPMRDGIKLFTCIYTPKNSKEKNPILMMRTPYSCAPYGEGRISPRLYNGYWKEYLKENYIIVIQDVRGKFMSEGAFEDVRPYIKNKKTKKDIDESTDTYDTADWLLKNIKNNNGKIGIFGISYPGFYATMAAASKHPAIKAVSPQAPVTEWFLGDDFHHNGAFALMDAFSFYYSFGMPRPTPTTSPAPHFNYPERDNYSFFLNTGPFKNFTVLFKDSIKFWNQITQHPNYDSFWQLRDARQACYDIKSSMLVVGGLFDAEDCYGAWNLYKALKKQSPATKTKLVMGPWVHGGWSRGDGSNLGNIRFGDKTSYYYQKEIEIPFFNYHLKGKGNISSMPEAQVFFTGENTWKNFSNWPPESSSAETFYFQSNGKLNKNKPQENEAFTTYISDINKPVPYAKDVHLHRTKEYMIDDQRFAWRRPDVISFETNPLEEDVTLAGVVTAILKVAVSGTDADFVVKLIDVFPNDFKYDSTYCCKNNYPETEMAGYQMLVRGEIMRGRYRKSFENPIPFVPQQTDEVKFDLPDVAHTFKKGHKIMIQIQSSWFPLFDRNPQQFVNIYTCSEKDYINAEVKLYHDRQNSSCIVLPILKK